MNENHELMGYDDADNIMPLLLAGIGAGAGMFSARVCGLHGDWAQIIALLLGAALGFFGPAFFPRSLWRWRNGLSVPDRRRLNNALAVVFLFLLFVLCMSR